MAPVSAVSVPFRPERELDELRDYLGSRYDPTLAPRFLSLVDEELASIGDEDQLYRRSQAYLYNLTFFSVTGTKLPYVRALTAAVPPPARLLDYGCGIGSDGLALIEAGYEVDFADFDNPSVGYLRWRLRRRGLRARIFDVDRAGPPPGYDAVFAFDVLEHVDDPRALLARLERTARVVCINLLESEEGETSLHRDLPVAALRRGICEQHEVLRYRRFHNGRSHLLIYVPGSPRPLRSRARRLAGAAISRVRALTKDGIGATERDAIAAASARLAREAGLEG